MNLYHELIWFRALWLGVVGLCASLAIYLVVSWVRSGIGSRKFPMLAVMYILIGAYISSEAITNSGLGFLGDVVVRHQDCKVVWVAKYCFSNHVEKVELTLESVPGRHRFKTHCRPDNIGAEMENGYTVDNAGLLGGWLWKREKDAARPK